MNCTANLGTVDSVTQWTTFAVTILTLLVNLHQSYHHRHFHSECCGCIIDSDHEQGTAPLP